jgi:hypothetical protein
MLWKNPTRLGITYPTGQILILISSSTNLKLKAEKVPLKIPPSSISLRTRCLNNGWNFTKNTMNKSCWKLSEHWNVICSVQQLTLYIHPYILHVLQMFKTNRRSTVLHKQAVSNSELLVFYSEQFHATFYGNVTNWSSTGFWDEIYGEPCKFRIRL